MLGRKLTERFSCGCSCWKLNISYAKKLLRSSPATWSRSLLGGGDYSTHKKWLSSYHQDAINVEAEKPVRLLTPTQLMFTGRSSDGRHLLKSSQFLQTELPRRIARRLNDFQSLPKVAAINPSIQELHDLYKQTFEQLTSFRNIVCLSDEEDFRQLLQRLLDEHANVASLLATAFREIKHSVPEMENGWDRLSPLVRSSLLHESLKHLCLEISAFVETKHSYDILGSLTERTLKSKLGIRLLVEHHIGLCNEKKDYIGAICTRTSPKQIIEKCHYHSQRMCEHRHGYSPGVMLSGHTKAYFPHFPCTLEYILQELLKNAMEATILHCKKLTSRNSSEIPSIHVTICNNKENFVIRISDKGGGVSEGRLKEIFKYSVTSNDDNNSGEELLKNKNDNYAGQGERTGGRGALGTLIDAVNITSVGGRISGYGFGLPSARAYTECLGGSLTFVPMFGLGSDIYLKISHITSDYIRI